MKRYALSTDEIFSASMESLSRNVGDYLFDSNAWKFTTPSCQGSLLNLRLADGLAIKITDLFTDKPVSFTNELIMPHVIELGFVSSGVVQMDVHGRRRDCDAIAGQNYLQAMEGDLKVKTNLPAGQHLRSIDIRFTPEALDRCCQQIGASLPSCLKKSCSAAHKAPFKRASVLTAEADTLVKEIFNHCRTEIFCPLFLESKTFDLVTRYLATVNQQSPITTTTLSPRDIECVREARNILIERMADPPSLMELARLVNLNDFKLKLGFRQAFGTTAYRYLKEIRLQTAKALLREQNISVTETALSVGYCNIGDFGIAFKRRFGASPKSILKR